MHCVGATEAGRALPGFFNNIFKELPALLACGQGSAWYSSASILLPPLCLSETAHSRGQPSLWLALTGLSIKLGVMRPWTMTYGTSVCGTFSTPHPMCTLGLAASASLSHV